MQRIFLISFCLLTLFFSDSIAQTYKLGDGNLVNTNTSYPSPYGNWYYGAKHQMLYYASELEQQGASAGSIYSLGYIVEEIFSGATMNNFTIRMGQTTVDEFSNSDFITDLETVFLSKPFTPSLGVNTHSLDFPFEWDGTSNIIVEVCFNNNFYIYNEGLEYTDGFSKNVTIYENEDELDVCSYSSGNTSKLRTNLIIGINSNDSDNDLTVRELSEYESQCDFNEQNEVSLTVKNFGALPQSNFTLSYQVNKGSIVSETVSDILYSKAEMKYVFNTATDFSNDGEYTIKAWVDLENKNDSYSHNDSIESKKFANLGHDISIITDKDKICPGKSALLRIEGSEDVPTYWYNSIAAKNPIAKGLVYQTPRLYETTSYYIEQSTYLSVKDISTKSSIFEHDDFAGDDRGGVAITPEYFYVVGDDYTVRVDADDFSNPVSLRMMDGLFSDLNSGRLYSLYDSDNEEFPEYESDPYYFNSIVELDVSLNIIEGSLIEFSNPIEVQSEYGSGVFAGQGYVIIYVEDTEEFHVIDLISGEVSFLGDVGIDLNGSENWADWGWSEFIDDDYYVIYRDDTDDRIVRLNLTTGDLTIVAEFDDLSDMASITYSPWADRMYWHYESDGQFGGDDETAGYLSARSVNSTYGECRIKATVVVDDCNANSSGGSGGGNAIIIITDTKEINVKSEFNLYPNPSDGNIQLAYTNVNSDLINVNVYDLVGKSVNQQSITVNNNSGTASINLSQLEKGIYFVNVSYNQSQQNTYRIVIN